MIRDFSDISQIKDQHGDVDFMCLITPSIKAERKPSEGVGEIFEKLRYVIWYLDENEEASENYR